MKKTKSRLDNLYLAAPCSISWDSMEGDDRVRACSGCNKNVFNISAISRNEAEAFLAEFGTSQCTRLSRRQDGTIITDDCPRGLRRLRDQCKLAGKVVAVFIATVLSIPAGYCLDKANVSGPQPVPKAAADQFVGHGCYLPDAWRGDEVSGEECYDWPTGEDWTAGKEWASTTTNPALVKQKKSSPSQIPQGNFDDNPWPDPRSDVETKKATAGSEPAADGAGTGPSGKYKTRETRFSEDNPEISEPRFPVIDRRAMQLHVKGKAALARGDFLRARELCRKSLAAFDLQGNGDPRYRHMIKADLEKTHKFFDIGKGSSFTSDLLKIDFDPY